LLLNGFRVGAYYGVRIFATRVEGQRGRCLAYAQMVVPKLWSGMIGIIHHIISVTIFDDERALCHTIVQRLPSSYLAGELLNGISCKREVLIELPCPDGVPISKLHHIEIKPSVLILEHMRVDTVFVPLILSNLLERSLDGGRSSMSNVYDMAVFSPIVYTEEQMEKPSAIDDVIGMHLIVLCSSSVGPFVVEVEHVDALIPMEHIVADKKIAIGGNAPQIILASIADTACIGHSPQDWILVGVRLLGKQGHGEKKKEQE
jgi:hypothetical protein